MARSSLENSNIRVQMITRLLVMAFWVAYDGLRDAPIHPADASKEVPSRAALLLEDLQEFRALKTLFLVFGNTGDRPLTRYVVDLRVQL